MAKQSRRERKTARDLFPDDVLILTLYEAEKAEAYGRLLNALVIDGVLPLEREQEVRKQILDREAVASTGIGSGVAIPHTKSKFAHRFGVAVGISEAGIEVGAHDGQPARAIFLWICPPSATPQHLALMRGIATLAKDHDVADRIANCRDKRSFLRTLGEIEME